MPTFLVDYTETRTYLVEADDAEAADSVAFRMGLDRQPCSNIEARITHVESVPARGGK